MKKPTLWIKWNYSNNNWLVSDTFEDYERDLEKSDIKLEFNDGYYILDALCPIGKLIMMLQLEGVELEEIAIYT